MIIYGENVCPHGGTAAFQNFGGRGLAKAVKTGEGSGSGTRGRAIWGFAREALGGLERGGSGLEGSHFRISL